MKMRDCERSVYALASRAQSFSLSLPVRRRWASMRASAQSRRSASCSFDISSEKKPTVSPTRSATCWATLRQKEVLPIAGRAATITRSPFCRPLVISSMSTNPVARPVTTSLLWESWSIVRKDSFTISRMDTKPARMRRSAMSKIDFSARSSSAAASSSPS